MSYPVTITLPNHVAGDQWEGIATIGPILVDGATPSGTLTRIRMQLRYKAMVFTIDSNSAANPDAPATISNAATWVATVPAIAGFLPTPGEWRWDMEFYKSGSLWKTLYSGALTVLPNVTIP